MHRAFGLVGKTSVLDEIGIEFSRGDGNWPRAVIAATLAASAYYVGTIVGFLLTPRGSTISTFWPPNAILLAALLVISPRYWWIVLAGVFPAHVAAQLQAGVPVARCIGWFFSNCAEALLGAYCIRYFVKTKLKFDSLRGVLIFLIFGCLFAPLVTSFLDAAVVVVTGWQANYWTMWTRRLFSNMLSILAVTPPLVILGQLRLSDFRKRDLAHYAEFVLVLCAVFLVSVYIFAEASAFPTRAPALMYVPIPFLVWAAVRMGPAGVASSLLIMAFVSIWEAIHGHGPFTSSSMHENVVYLQISHCIITVPLMLLAAMLGEHHKIEAELRSSKSKLIEAQEEERRRIATELHDDVGQQLALAQTRLSELKTISSVVTAKVLEKLSSQLANISDDIREISHGLYPSLLQHLGLASAIRRLSREICAERTVTIDITNTVTEHLPPDVSLAIYRIAQEALHNIEKHSQARNVEVKVDQTSDVLVLIVRDNGIGFDTDHLQSGGLGVESMRERITSVGGHLRITSAPGKGTQVEAFAPLRMIELARTG